MIQVYVQPDRIVGPDGITDFVSEAVMNAVEIEGREQFALRHDLSEHEVAALAAGRRPELARSVLPELHYDGVSSLSQGGTVSSGILTGPSYALLVLRIQDAYRQAGNRFVGRLVIRYKSGTGYEYGLTTGARA